MQTLKLPFLAFVFALVLIGYSIWDLDQLSGPGPTGHYSLASVRIAPGAASLPGTPVLADAESRSAGLPAQTALGGGVAMAVQERPTGPVRLPSRDAATKIRNQVLAPWVAVSCRIAMGVTMAFMLLIMI